MRTPLPALAFGLVALALGACSEMPTAIKPAGPSYDGGHVFGSGAYSGSDSTTTAGASVETTATDSTETARGGHVFGSGA